MSEKVNEKKLNEEYYLVQKRIQGDWVDKKKEKNEEKALETARKMAEEELAKKNDFSFRVIFVREVCSLTLEKDKPESMLDMF